MNATMEMPKLLGRAWALRERDEAEALADLERTFGATPEQAKAALTVARGFTEHPTMAKTLPDVEAETQRLRTQREARKTVDYEDAEAAMRLPPTRSDYSLKAYLAEPKPPKLERIEQLQRAGHRTALVAAYKTGKTTLHSNLTRALVDDKPFLGRFKVKPPQGRVGCWNAEMDGDDYEQYLVDAGVQNTPGVAVLNLRGYRLPLLSEAGRNYAVEWLKSNEVTYWIVDPWSRLCSWSNVDENVNAEVLPLLQRVEEICDEAGIEELLVVHHAGYVRGRARGASVFSDAFDGLWLYERGEDEERDTRFFRAEGRKVAVDEGTVELDGGRTTYHAGGRLAAKLNGVIKTVVQVVTENPGIKTGELKGNLRGAATLKDRAVTAAIDRTLIRAQKVDGRTTEHYPVEGGGMDL